MTTGNGHREGEPPDDARLRVVLDDFRAWLQDRSGTMTLQRLADASGISLRQLYRLRDGERMWSAQPRSYYWRWLERRRALRSMDAAALTRLAEEFRIVGKTIGQSVLSVSESWWRNGGYGALGVEVRGEGDELEVEVHDAQGAGAADADDESAVAADGAGANDDLGEEYAGADAEAEGWAGTPPRADEAQPAIGDAASDDGAPGDGAPGDEDEVDDDGGLDDGSDEGEGLADAGANEPRTRYALPVDEPASDTLAAMSEGERDRLEERVRQAASVAEVASISGAPVLRVVPGLTLADAKKSALLRLNGWHPAQIARERGKKIEEYEVADVGGLWGDGPFMLHDGNSVDYEDDGARLVAFAPVTAWGEEGSLHFTALWMRSGVTMAERQRKHAVSTHDGRPTRIGHRLTDSVPRRRYPDSDWFFGSEGTLNEGLVRELVEVGFLYPDDPEVLAELAEADMRLVPLALRRGSRAELLSYWYQVREVADAFSAVEGFGETLFGLELERVRLSLEYRMLSDHYALTPHYYGVGRRLPRSGRVSERRWMRERIEEIPAETKRVRRKQRRRRFFGALFLGWFRALRRWGYRRKYRRLRKRGMVTGADRIRTREEMEWDGEGWVRMDLEHDSLWDREYLLGLGFDESEGFDWDNYEALSEVPREIRFGSLEPELFCGHDYTRWGAQLVPWDRIDRRRWYSVIDWGSRVSEADVVDGDYGDYDYGYEDGEGYEDGDYDGEYDDGELREDEE